MQTLRKKSSPLKYKNETTKFLGDGVSFKAKLIGILEVSEARGDRMCQEALSDLKMAIRAAGEHKQRIAINIAIDGLRLKDEKTGDSLYHHPVHKISFIAQDMTDSRAFGYIFGSPDTGHRFFGIKTDKAASQVVIAMRDLFQVVFALKKKEVELAKQQLDKTRLTSSPLFADSSPKSTIQETVRHAPSDIKSSQESKQENTAVADLVDLELELNSLQQGLHQMESLTPSDPFGDSFIPYTKPILPPPPSSGRERSNRSIDSTGSFNSPKAQSTDSRLPSNDLNLFDSKTEKTEKDLFFTRDGNCFDITEDSQSGLKFTFEKRPLVPEPSKDAIHEKNKQDILSQFDVFTELDPLGTGRSKPYVDKKHFFQELKNPPKKVLNELATAHQPDSSNTMKKQQNNDFVTDPFSDPFDTDPFLKADFAITDPFEKEFPNFGTSFLKSNDFDNVTFDTGSKNEYFGSIPQNNFAKSPKETPFESECVPTPPPRPEVTLTQIKPPPLPPKKIGSDLEFKTSFETRYQEPVHHSLPFVPTSDTFSEKSPPLPVPMRKTGHLSEEKPQNNYYLTPISAKQTFEENVSKTTSIISIPPPQRANRKKMSESKSPSLEPRPPSASSENLSSLDITLSQLTLSGLTELASKLNVPAKDLSNMTLVQLTQFLSKHLSNKNEGQTTPCQVSTSENFNADFVANFSKLDTESTNTTYDRYAVFRELISEEKKVEVNEEKEEESIEQPINISSSPSYNVYESNVDNTKDKYAALREIVENELQNNQTNETNQEENSSEKINNEKNDNDTVKDQKLEEITKIELVQYNNYLANNETKSNNETVKTPPKSPDDRQATSTVIKPPTETNIRPNSESLSDVLSGSSTEIDNTGSNSELAKKQEDATGESWAIFEKGVPPAPIVEKQRTQSEEGISPWSSDSKEFGNGSSLEWHKGDSESGEQWVQQQRSKQPRKDQEGWWDTSAEPEVYYCPSNRRSTDSYDDENYECYEKPRRRNIPSYGHEAQAPGGHSSSSRDVSPWEEEPRREPRVAWNKHVKQHSVEKYRDRRPTDSWDDEEDDDEYEDERVQRYYRPERQKWETENERYDVPGREHSQSGDWNEDRRYRRRRDADWERWCCPEWVLAGHDKPPSRYSGSRYGHPEMAGVRHPRKHDERCYSRESQISPWEDDYSNEAPEIPSYATSKRHWKRPSSASEMERKSIEMRSRYYPGGSDSERERRYKSGRRSRSRDSQYGENSARHKTEMCLMNKGPPHRNKQYNKQFDSDFDQSSPKTQNEIPRIDHSKKSVTLMNRKKIKESPKSEMNIVSTFPRKTTFRSKSLFENDFVPNIDTPPRDTGPEQEFEASECESPSFPIKPIEIPKQQRLRDIRSPRFQSRTKSLFEDDYAPNDRPEVLQKDSSILSIKEEDDTTINKKNLPASNKKKFLKNSGEIQRDKANIRKSDSVNIFTCENDPFDDDFFTEKKFDAEDVHFTASGSMKIGDLKWGTDFEEFPVGDK